MKTRLLFLITDLDIGGAPLVVKQLACGLDHQRFHIAVASLAPAGPIGRELRQKGVPVYDLGARGPWDFRVFSRLARLIAEFRPSILLCSLVHANVVGRLVGLLGQVPFIIAAIHTAEQGKKWHLLAENLTCRLSRLTLSVSPSVAQHVRRFSHVPLSRIRIIPSGLDWQHFADAEPLSLSELGLSTPKKTLISVGRLDEVKALDVLLKAVKILIPHHDLRLLIVGDGPERTRLEQITEKLNLRNHVTFLGMRRDVAPLLKASNIYVQPSLWEGQGLAAMEAMAAGLPVVASNTTGLTDLIENDKTGLIVPVGNPSDLADAIARLITDPSHAARLARNAQEFIQTSFNLPTMINAYTSLFDELFARHNH